MKQIFFVTALLLFLQTILFSQKPGIPDASTALTTTASETRSGSFDSWFLDKTMRLDYYHSGNTKEEHFAIDQIVSDGQWPGSKNVLIDKLELGLYFFEVKDGASDKIIYSRGFSSVFGEWQSIPDADVMWGTFPESIRFPWPKNPVSVILKRRNAENIFSWSGFFDSRLNI